MSVQEVRAAILKVQPRIFEYEPAPRRDLNPDAPANNHETSTRYLLVDPILRSLGWDLSDPGDCVVEYRVSPRSMSAVDYALLDGRGNPAVLVEAKSESTWTPTSRRTGNRSAATQMKPRLPG